MPFYLRRREVNDILLKNVDPTVKKETRFIAVIVLLLSVLMQAVFLILRRWDVSVLLGNLYGAVIAVGNFFLMGLSLQKSLSKDPKDAKSYMQVSHSLRLILLLVIAVVGYTVPFFHLGAVVIPYLFPRVAVALRSCLGKKEGGRGDGK